MSRDRPQAVGNITFLSCRRRAHPARQPGSKAHAGRRRHGAWPVRSGRMAGSDSSGIAVRTRRGGATLARCATPSACCEPWRLDGR
ncbi:putative lipoprotein [Bordetella bronchiseptica SBL-F6116]|nr:putative lipoprotein [Bordetella bronchiseptica 00-P-2730]KDE00441.1 putative lipoprotein [Bordetella bronchiseptica SBL-F6116]